MSMLLAVVVLEAVMGAVLFGSAGRIDLPWFWAVLGVHGASMLVASLAIDPDLHRERLRPGPGGGRDRWVRVAALPMILGHLIVAGLDVGRFGWSGRLPGWVQGVALAAYAGGLSLSIGAMIANRFFSPVVRIQSERGHRVVTSGPYRLLRHPGYAGLLVASTAGGIALGSWWSLLPLLPCAALFVARTAWEDRFLRERLEGYAEYAGRVRFRLLPGLW
jgi:protein-S-isoprenylcysteine O-methyltransferase Ste14